MGTDIETSLQIARHEDELRTIRGRVDGYVSAVNNANQSIAGHRERIVNLERRGEEWDAMNDTVVELKTTIKNARWTLGFVVAASSALAAFAGVAVAFAALR